VFKTPNTYYRKTYTSTVCKPCVCKGVSRGDLLHNLWAGSKHETCPSALWPSRSINWIPCARKELKRGEVEYNRERKTLKRATKHASSACIITDIWSQPRGGVQNNFVQRGTKVAPKCLILSYLDINLLHEADSRMALFNTDASVVRRQHGPTWHWQIPYHKSQIQIHSYPPWL
jgi:hypothetical protein